MRYGRKEEHKIDSEKKFGEREKEREREREREIQRETK
jgi:hypothetical protein